MLPAHWSLVRSSFIFFANSSTDKKEFENMHCILNKKLAVSHSECNLNWCTQLSIGRQTDKHTKESPNMCKTKNRIVDNCDENLFYFKII